MIPTLEDVGRNCGVSRSTVSRVINNSPLVNEATKQRVLKAIKEMGYAPNLIARSLTKNKTETIAVTLPDITGGVFPEILAGLDDVASQRGYHLLVVFVGGQRPGSVAVEDLFRNRRADGVVAVASLDKTQLLALAELNVPAVCVAQRSPTPSIPNVLFDDRGGALRAARHLLEQGRRQLIHIRGPETNYDAVERCLGFKMALEEAGLKFSKSLEFKGDFQREGGIRAIKEALNKKVPFDGIFASNDGMAIGVIETLNDRGISIPDQVEIVGFDDIESARFVGLSTVRVPLREMGRVAARIVLDQIDGKEAGSEILSTELVVRASSTPGHKVSPIKINHSSH